ncbi:MAG: hypothetical protein VX938_14280, partial [Myxococcota bacterium]|nr:hypothetical protein [Myxococcota bacterium]
ETVPDDVGRPALHRMLEQGRSTLSDFDAANLELAELHVAEGDLSRAEGLLEALSSSFAIQRLELLLAQEHDNPRRLERAVDALREALPTSCEVFHTWLVVHGERLRDDPSALSGVRSEPGCMETQLALAALEVEGWALKRAEGRLEEAMERLGPGMDRERGALLQRRVQVGQGNLSHPVGEPMSPEMAWWLSGLKSPVLSPDLRRQLVHSPALDDEARQLLLDPETELGLPLADPRSILRGSTPEGHSALILLNDIHGTVMSDGAVVRRHHRLIHIGDEDAVEAWGEQELPEGAEILVARTWEPSDSDKWLPVSAEDLPDTGAISLPRVAVGVVLEVAWLVWEVSPLDAR